MAARAAQFVFTLPPRIVSPAVNTSNLLSRHTLGPRGMRHQLLWGRQLNGLVLKIDISKTLEGSRIGDVSPGGVGGGGVTIDEDARNFEMCQKRPESSSAWS
jgi:hypothetical protein